MDNIDKPDYDNIPVYFCSRCNSLKILRIDASVPSSPSICGVCGSGRLIKKSNIKTLIGNGIIKNPVYKK